MKHLNDKNNAIEKTLIILQSFISGKEEMGTTEISKEFGFNKATVSRILGTLTKFGYVCQNPVSKKYRLGETALKLGAAGGRFLKSNITRISRPYIDELSKKTRETVALEVFSGESNFMAYVREGMQRIRIAASVGEILPRHASAGSKAVLAYLPENICAKLIKTPMQKFTENTITNQAEFIRHLEEVRKNGVSFDFEEIDMGVNAIGAPIFDHSGEPVAAVVIVGPSERIPGEKKADMVRLLKKTASSISSQLHYSSDAQLTKANEW
jgi:DNA-binding IclR family transcriptional regulator